MKQLIVVLICLMLSGCGREIPTARPETEPAATVSAAATGLYDPDHPIQRQYPGLVRAYPLGTETAQGIRALGRDVLLLSGDSSTTLTRYTGDDLIETARVTLDFFLDPEDLSLQIHENGISYFDPRQNVTIVLDHRLQEVRRIPSPLGLSGKPILSAGEDILYYCTGWSVVAWELESGIRRTVRELAYENQKLTGLHQDDWILECQIQDKDSTKKLLLSADQGTLIHPLSEDTVLHTENGHYFCAVASGYQTLLLFGADSASPELLLPAQNWDRYFYLPEDHALVTVNSGNDGTRLDYYELNTGILRASVSLDTSPKSIVNTGDHCIYILSRDAQEDHDTIYRWDVLRQSPDPANTAAYRTAYRSQDDPDTAALEACQAYADRIGEKYGISIRIGEAAAAVQPWDYVFQPEILAPILQKELQLLEKRLAQYPQTLLEQTASHFAGLTLCLVRSITGTGDPGSLSSATGIQFFKDQGAYVVITTGKYSEQALYHELYHVMETHILTESTALDQWNSLNPADFTYQKTQPQESEAYLKGQTRAFADRYSMTYPKEDRARILENAMLPGKEKLFQSEYMQRKLRALCIGIRDAYRLKSQPGELPWEQYLVNLPSTK